MTVTPNNPQELEAVIERLRDTARHAADHGGNLTLAEVEFYVDAAKAEERERIVKELREAAHGGNRGQPGSFWVGWRAAARAIEEGWAEKPETDT